MPDMTPAEIADTLLRAVEGGFFDDVPPPGKPKVVRGGEEAPNTWTAWTLARARELVGDGIRFADLRAGGYLDTARPCFARDFWQGIFGRGKVRLK
jgi:hypothetical protein